MGTTPRNVTVDKETRAPAPAGSMPWQPLATLREEVNRLFDDFFSGWPMASLRRRRVDTDPWRRLQGMFEATFPAADVVAGEKGYKITAELPGMSEQEIEIALAGDVLTLKGEKREEHEEKGEDRYVSERRYGSYQRSFALPDDADTEKIEAAFKNGVLTITLPKRPEAQAKQRKIEVKAA